MLFHFFILLLSLFSISCDSVAVLDSVIVDGVDSGKNPLQEENLLPPSAKSLALQVSTNEILDRTNFPAYPTPVRIKVSTVTGAAVLTNAIITKVPSRRRSQPFYMLEIDANGGVFMTLKGNGVSFHLAIVTPAHTINIASAPLRFGHASHSIYAGIRDLMPQGRINTPLPEISISSAEDSDSETSSGPRGNPFAGYLNSP